MASPRIAILASGSGTTAESFIKSVINKEVSGEVVLLVCNNKKAKVFERIRNLNKSHNLNIQAVHIGKSTHPPVGDEPVEFGRQTAAEEKAILKLLIDMRIDLVLLLGYMKLVGKSIVDTYGWKEDFRSVYQSRMINTHPGLLPATKGLYGIHVQKAVITRGMKAGHCLFAVDSEYDDGPVISHHEIPRVPDETPDELFERIKASEKAHLARDVDRFIINQQKYQGEH
ncbi:MAG TPA: formyltransferase family protein [Candidatus Saccharimonadales bacterium]|nr:formyltransferase family protein [Candidatus Saccharimonadales bacterium]